MDRVPSSSTKSPWRGFQALLILVLTSAASGAAGWWLKHAPRHWWREDIIAEFHDQIVSKADLEESLRVHLWRRGLDWKTLDERDRANARRQVFNDLITARVLRHSRLQDPPMHVADATARELDFWRRQFPTEQERRERIALQKSTALQFERLVANDAADQAWLEARTNQRAALPTEADVRAWFGAHGKSLRIPTAYRAAHIYLTRHEKDKPDRRGEIEAVYRKLTTGQATFAELAATHSEDERSKNRGGDLGWFTRDRMPEDFLAGVEKLAAGETGTPLATGLGWHIVQLTERQPSRLPNLEEVRGEIEAMLQARAREAALAALLTELVEKARSELWICEAALLEEIAPAPL